MNVLETIMAERRADAERARQQIPLRDLEARAKARQPRSLMASLRGAPGLAVIAELKRASPSAGELRADLQPADLARSYEAHGAVGLSVLTEPRHFRGSDDDLRQVRNAVALPVLRKDFMGDVYQVYEAAALGADAVLLILAALDDARVSELSAAARFLSLDVLAEAHTEDEVERALGIPGAIIGVNSRDLKSLRTDLSVARRLAAGIPRDRLSVAESGIRTREEMQELRALGYAGFLIGETLVRSQDPGLCLRRLLTGTESCVGN